MGRHSSASGRAIHLNPGCQGDLAGWPIGSHRDLPLPFHADANASPNVIGGKQVRVRSPAFGATRERGLAAVAATHNGMICSLLL
jgi:hypothetical protein